MYEITPKCNNVLSYILISMDLFNVHSFSSMELKQLLFVSPLLKTWDGRIVVWCEREHDKVLMQVKVYL